MAGMSPTGVWVKGGRSSILRKIMADPGRIARMGIHLYRQEVTDERVVRILGRAEQCRDSVPIHVHVTG